MRGCEPAPGVEWKAKSGAFGRPWRSRRNWRPSLGDEAARRAQHGLRRYKFTNGGEPIKHPVTGKPYFEREYRDMLLIFLLKAKRPAVYRERHQIQHAGEVTYAKARDSGGPASADRGGLIGPGPAA